MEFSPLFIGAALGIGGVSFFLLLRKSRLQKAQFLNLVFSPIQLDQFPQIDLIPFKLFDRIASKAQYFKIMDFSASGYPRPTFNRIYGGPYGLNLIVTQHDFKSAIYFTLISEFSSGDFLISTTDPFLTKFPFPPNQHVRRFSKGASLRHIERGHIQLLYQAEESRMSVVSQQEKRFFKLFQRLHEDRLRHGEREGYYVEKNGVYFPTFKYHFFRAPLTSPKSDKDESHLLKAA